MIDHPLGDGFDFPEIGDILPESSLLGIALGLLTFRLHRPRVITFTTIAKHSPTTAEERRKFRVTALQNISHLLDPMGVEPGNRFFANSWHLTDIQSRHKLRLSSGLHDHKPSRFA